GSPRRCPDRCLQPGCRAVRDADRCAALPRQVRRTVPAGAGNGPTQAPASRPRLAARSGNHLFPDYRKIRREMFLKEIACGPLALMKLLQDFGVPLGEDEAEDLLAEAGDKGIDMLRLK